MSRLVLAAVAALIGVLPAAREFFVGARTINGAVLHTPTDDTALDPETGAVRSMQAADIIVPDDALEGLWSPESLERLARRAR